MSSQILEKLKQFPLFVDVPDERLEQMSQKTLVHEFNRQDYIWNEADISRYLYIIVSGRVKILKHSETGKDVIVEIYGPGEAIGEMSLLVGGTYTTAAVCLSSTELLCVPKQQILDLLAAVPGMAFLSLRSMAKRQRMLMQKIKELAAGGVEYRMAHLLLKLADRIGEESTDSGIKIPLFLSRQDIADLVGTTVETAIRVMSRWRKMDIVTNDKKGIIIRDRETLEDLAAGITMHI